MHKRLARLHRKRWNRPAGCLGTSAVASIKAGCLGTSAVASIKAGCLGTSAAASIEAVAGTSAVDRLAVCFLLRARMILGRSNHRHPRQQKQCQGRLLTHLHTRTRQ